MEIDTITLQLRSELRRQRFSAPVAYVYNPLQYAWSPHAEYLRRYGRGQREIVLVGMNPGPWGMVQTGVPFGDIVMVRDWLGIMGQTGKPEIEHPRRRVEGFGCHRREISGRRFWGWARDTFVTPDRFFKYFFVVNYCPLCFFEAGGGNLTPDRFGSVERQPLFAACDRALRAMVSSMRPWLVIGIGRFAERRAHAALAGLPLTVAAVLHPSGANPRASRDWGGQMNRALKTLRVKIGATHHAMHT
jgi:single-strand selective monofunctional uracil DNA glycosylase